MKSLIADRFEKVTLHSTLIMNSVKRSLHLFRFAAMFLALSFPLAYGAVNMKIGDVFPLGRLMGAKGPVILDSSAYTVVYFYPKDQTPGCTIEAHEFQTLKPEFDKAHIRILGASADDSASHQAFCDKLSLAFDLTTDPALALGKELGIDNGGHHARTTFVLDHDGHVVLIYEGVKPKGHAHAVMSDIQALKKSP